MSLEPVNQQYYDRDYFETGSKTIVDPRTGETKKWGYLGTNWSGNYHIVQGLLEVFEANIGSVLDLGAGQGSFTDYAIRAGLQAKGYDFSEFAVTHPHGFAAGNLFQLDVTNGIPEPDASYDLIFCSDMCEHIQKSKIEAVIKEFFRVTRKWVFLQFPVVQTPEEVFDWEQEAPKSDADKHYLWAHFMISGHLNMEQRSWWDAKFTAQGFKIREDLVTGFRQAVPREVLMNWYNILVLEKP